MSSSSSQEMMNSKNFSESYSMLMSQYFKENKGSFGPTPMNLSLSSSPAGAPAMDLSPSGSSNRQVNVMDFFPQNTGFGPSTPSSLETPKKVECERAHPMTIFYGGKVVVIDYLSEAKAQEVLGLAKKFSVVNNSTTRQPPSSFVAPNDFIKKDAPNDFIKKDALPPRHHQQQKQQTINASDLPISRNASLHRFLAKRKDRINSRAPYQVGGSSSSASGKADEAKANIKVEENKKIWLGLGSQSAQQLADLGLQL
ncbi:hypothetical protein C5167_044815 [Papaver somniferum]|uniref:protein TIFY 10a-like n=1 Tax=Papaver somniferum TaxID=3469 RepID=UPI000E701C03|nr:protein TIFY 10a-like [Papaver somniferum]RZC90183.1 hypothetical protein C5167_044815 [Papaver somniferum]